jgi:hypothetical protein
MKDSMSSELNRQSMDDFLKASTLSKEAHKSREILLVEGVQIDAEIPFKKPTIMASPGSV